MAVAPDGTVYVADRGNHRIQRFSATGTFLGQWGSCGSGDGQFNWPAGVAVAPDGTVYVADTYNHRIQRFSATGTFLGKWGSEGSGDGQFYYPDGVAVAPDGTVYVADTYNYRIQRFSATGAFLGQWGSYGSGDGQFDRPHGVAVAPDGTVYVADSNNDRIQRFSATGTFLGKWGSRGYGDGRFYYPWGVAVAPDGTVYVADSRNHRIQRFSATGAFLNKWGSYGSGDGQFYYPDGVAVAPDGTVYVADTWNHRIQRFSATGTFLGKWGSYGSGDGQFYYPDGVAVAPDGTVYVADSGNNRIQVFGTSYPTTWRGEFYGNDWLAERPLAIMNTNTLDFEWADGSPAPGVPDDHFTDRWLRYVNFEAGFHRFTVFTDDGVRFWIDDRLVLESWQHQRQTYEVTVYLEAGYHRLRVEHWEDYGWAALSLSWENVTRKVHLPLALRDYIAYFEGPWEQEPNNSYLEANGPLRSGQDYYGYPNDEKDYFSIYLRTAGTITIDLTDHTGTGVQVQLFYQTVGNRVAGDMDAPYHVEYTGPAGWYYIYIYTAGGYNSTTPYTLRATFP